MNKLFLCFLSLWLLLSCEKEKVSTIGSNTKPTVDLNKVVTFDGSVKTILATHCGPCHMPGGDRINKWDTYNKTKTFYSDIIDRIQKPESQSSFMPKNGKRIPQSDINALLKWEKDGFLEK